MLAFGSGPVIFTGVDQWKQGDHCFLVRNPDYFIEGQPYVDRVEFYRIADAAGEGRARAEPEPQRLGGETERGDDRPFLLLLVEDPGRRPHHLDHLADVAQDVIQQER